MAYSSKDILDEYNENNGGTSISDIKVDGAPTKFEMWYSISNYQVNEYHDGMLRIHFDAPEGSRWNETCIIYLPINGNTESVQHFEFETSIPVGSISNMYFDGTYDIHVELYAESVSTETATTTTTGIVRPTATSAISVVEKDIKDENGNITAKAGDIDVKLGDGLNKNEKGELCTTSDLSGSNWQNLLRFTNGFIVNGEIAEDGTISPSVGYFFERLATGDLLYKNANRTITIASYSSVMPTYEAPKEDGEEETTDGV